MPLKRVGELIAGIGVIIMACAYFWFASFYTQVADVLGFKVPLPNDCLYQLSGPCRAPAAVANLLGGRSYEPLLFWAGSFVAAVGALFIVMGQITSPRRSPKTFDVSDWLYGDQHEPPPPQRIEPHL